MTSRPVHALVRWCTTLPTNPRPRDLCIGALKVVLVTSVISVPTVVLGSVGIWVMAKTGLLPGVDLAGFLRVAGGFLLLLHVAALAMGAAAVTLYLLQRRLPAGQRGASADHERKRT